MLLGEEEWRGKDRGRPGLCSAAAEGVACCDLGMAVLGQQLLLLSLSLLMILLLVLLLLL